MIHYKLRSRAIVDIVNDIQEGIIILSPFFQRNLVWRVAHKVDFIKTILEGFPFPEIFMSRGTLDLETRKSTSFVVDGQQRMNSIKEFIEGDLEVDGRRYEDLEASEKEQFLKYEVAIMDLDMAQDDPRVIEIFKRLNRTFYSLSSIEKLSTEFGSSEFMLIAKLLCGELYDEEETDDNIDANLYKNDPSITREFTKWGNSVDVSMYRAFILESPIFTKHEIARQVHLMFTLNIMATMMFGIYGRNEQVKPHLETYADEFEGREEVLRRLQESAALVNRMNFPSDSYWQLKSNAFSLLIGLDGILQEGIEVPPRKTKQALTAFANEIPDDYALAARESVNNKRQRLRRQDYISEVLAAVV